jgi:hypothetical protein
MQEGRVDRFKDRLPKKKVITGVGIFHFLDYSMPFENERTKKGSSTRKTG